MPITRSRVLIRAKYGWPRKQVPFDPNAFHQPDGYRQNAMGYLSMCWDLPVRTPHNIGGLSAVSMIADKIVTEIEPKDLKPGDAIGYLGTETIDRDGGFVVLFERWLEPGTALTWDHHRGVDPGPDQRARPVDFRWHAYRLTEIIDE